MQARCSYAGIADILPSCTLAARLLCEYGYITMFGLLPAMVGFSSILMKTVGACGSPSSASLISSKNVVSAGAGFASNSGVDARAALPIFTGGRAMATWATVFDFSGSAATAATASDCFGSVAAAVAAGFAVFFSTSAFSVSSCSDSRTVIAPVFGSITLQATGILPPGKPSLCAAAFETSSTKPGDPNGPRSFTTTTQDFPLRVFVTCRCVPNGSVLCAAVNLNLSCA